MARSVVSAKVGLPDDYPGRTIRFADDIENLAYMIVGLQDRGSDEAEIVRQRILAAMSGLDGPEIVEALEFVDSEGHSNDVLLAFWASKGSYERWWTRGDVVSLWADFRSNFGQDLGIWREVMTPHKDRYQYGAGVPHKAGIGVLGELIPCDKFGYWGGYRDRVPASSIDRFRPSIKCLPEPAAVESLGKCLIIDNFPDNLCFIREGQGWERCDADELMVWEKSMAPVVDGWIDELAADPVATGCISIRAARERDRVTNHVLKRQSQIGFLLSLKHIEAAARSNPKHLEVHASFSDMYRCPKFNPQMHVWVEMFILKAPEIVAEYINCSSATGFLPFFAAREISGH